MSSPISPKPGDVYACPAYRHNGAPRPVVIERVTKTQAIDTDGKRWRLDDGYRVGDRQSRIRPWTEDDDRAVREEDEAQRYRAALDALGAAAFNWNRLPTPAAVALALPHLEAAVAVIKG